MDWVEAAGAALFAATFLLLALGRIGRLPVPRGASALLGGTVTFLLLAPTGRMTWQAWTLVDWQVIGLLAGLMVLAGLAEAVGLFAGLRRRLVHLHPAWALWVCLAIVACTSAVLLNDAAVVVLVPFLLPMLKGMGLPPVGTVALLATAANVGSLLTPFGNPQNAVLAANAGLGVTHFLRVQSPLVLLAMGLLGLASLRLSRRLEPAPAVILPHAVARGRWWLASCVAAFVALAVAAPGRPGLAACACAALAYAGLRPVLGRDADRSAWRTLDWNVLLLFFGLYLLTAGLPAWFPSDRFPLASLGLWRAAAATTAASNVVGNVPAMLTFLRLDAGWTALHADFLVTVSTLGGAMLLTGSAASLLAADAARRCGVEVRFVPFLRHAAPWVAPVLVLGAWLTWPR